MFGISHTVTVLNAVFKKKKKKWEGQMEKIEMKRIKAKGKKLSH